MILRDAVADDDRERRLRVGVGRRKGNTSMLADSEFQVARAGGAPVVDAMSLCFVPMWFEDRAFGLSSSSEELTDS